MSSCEIISIPQDTPPLMIYLMLQSCGVFLGCLFGGNIKQSLTHKLCRCKTNKNNNKETQVAGLTVPAETPLMENLPLFSKSL